MTYFSLHVKNETKKKPSSERVLRLRARQRRLGARENRHRVVQRLVVGRASPFLPEVEDNPRRLLLRLPRHCGGVQVRRLVAERADDVPEILALLLDRKSVV